MTDISVPAIAKGAECVIGPKRSITPKLGFPVSLTPDLIFGETRMICTYIYFLEKPSEQYLLLPF